MATHARSDLHPRWRPASRLGWWAVALAGVSLTGIALLVLGFALDVVQPADSYTDSAGQLAWGAGIWGCAVAALVTGLVAMLRHHDRSWLVVLATALGLLPAVMLVSEIALGEF